MTKVIAAAGDSCRTLRAHQMMKQADLRHRPTSLPRSLSKSWFLGEKLELSDLSSGPLGPLGPLGPVGPLAPATQTSHNAPRHGSNVHPAMLRATLCALEAHHPGLLVITFRARLWHATGWVSHWLVPKSSEIIKYSTSPLVNRRLALLYDTFLYYISLWNDFTRHHEIMRYHMLGTTPHFQTSNHPMFSGQKADHLGRQRVHNFPVRVHDGACTSG